MFSCISAEIDYVPTLSLNAMFAKYSDKHEQIPVLLVFLLGILYLLQKHMVYHKILNTLHGHGCGCLCLGQARVSNSADLLGICHDAKYHLESKMGVGV
jgi:hypothetical protein